MIKIYGPPQSSAGRCYWCLCEVDIPFEAVAVNMREKEHKSPEFLALNPNGKVPTLDDDGYVIWESMAINTYLSEKYKPELMGATPSVRGRVQQWSYWSILELQPPLIDIFIQKVFVPEEHRSQEKIDKALESLPGKFSILDKALGQSSYLAGNAFTIADLNTASVASIAHHLQIDLGDYRHIQDWLGRIAQRPAFQKYMEMLK